jgi:hypothetical protein
MIKLKDLLVEGSNLKWILGYVDSYGKVHYKVVGKDDSIDSHNQIWPGPKHGKWRWMPGNPSHLNTYGEELSFEDEDRIWKIIDKYKSLSESPDSVYYGNNEYSWYDDGSYTFLVYNDIVDNQRYWFAWDYSKKTILCENKQVENEILHTDDVILSTIEGRQFDGYFSNQPIGEAFMDLEDRPTHNGLIELLSTLRRCYFNRDYAECDGRVYDVKGEDKYLMSFWQEDSVILKDRNKLDDFFNRVGIDKNKILFERFDRENTVNYYQFFGTKPPEISDVERQKQQIARDLHMKKAQLDKAILDALQSKPKDINSLYAALEKQLNMPLAKIKHVFRGIPLDKLVVKQLREFVSRVGIKN